MSSENVDRFRRTVEAFNARDIEAFIVHFDPDVEFHSSFAGIDAVYRGHEGLRSWHRNLEEAWAGEIRSEPEAYFDLGEHTLVLSVLRSRGRQSGAEVQTADVLVARWRDGRIDHMKSYGSKAEALRGLGVPENTLDPISP